MAAPFESRPPGRLPGLAATLRTHSGFADVIASLDVDIHRLEQMREYVGGEVNTPAPADKPKRTRKRKGLPNGADAIV